MSEKNDILEQRVLDETDAEIEAYLEAKDQLRIQEQKVASMRAALTAAAGIKTDRYALTIQESRREYLKSLGELKDRFTPSELKGLLGVSKISTLRIVKLQ